MKGVTGSVEPVDYSHNLFEMQFAPTAFRCDQEFKPLCSSYSKGFTYWTIFSEIVMLLCKMDYYGFGKDFRGYYTTVVSRPLI